MTFEKWKQEQCLPDNIPHLDIVKEAWQAATLAERERAAKVAEDHEPQGYTDGYDAACIASYNIAAAIRKGGGV